LGQIFRHRWFLEINCRNPHDPLLFVGLYSREELCVIDYWSFPMQLDCSTVELVSHTPFLLLGLDPRSILLLLMDRPEFILFKGLEDLMKAAVADWE